VLPICLCINSFWELVGEIRYLYARNILQRYTFLTKNNIISKIVINNRNSANPHFVMNWISC
jgi:hypothetical protein